MSELKEGDRVIFAGKTGTITEVAKDARYPYRVVLDSGGQGIYAASELKEAGAENLAQEATKNKELLLDILEHQVLGSGRVIDAARAEATPCKGFTFDSETYAWSPGILGLISSKKNPEQLEKYCALGIEPAGDGVAERFKKVKEAVEDAHQTWQKEGGDLESWWHKVGESLEKHKIEL